MSSTTQFKAVATPSGKRAYEAVCAVHRSNEHGEVMIAAPTLEALVIAWRRMTASELDATKAQYVWVVKGRQ